MTLMRGKFARDLLPVVDNLQRALDAARQEIERSPLAKGVDLVRSQLLNILRRQDPSGSCAPENDWHDPRGRIVVVTGCQVEPAFFFIWSTGVGLGHFIPPAPHPAFHH
jgi:hypothetical protein